MTALAACTPYDILQLGTFALVTILLALYFIVEWARGVFWGFRIRLQQKHPELYSRLFK